MHVRWSTLSNTVWSAVFKTRRAVVLCILVIFLQDIRVRASGTTPSVCQNLSPKQLDSVLRDEGDFDSRYMAPDLEEAVNKFSDLADSKFIRKAEAYTCDAQCMARTDQIRSAFAKYGQMPKGDAVPPSFADVRDVLEGHLGPAPIQSPPENLFTGPLFTNSAIPGQVPQQTTDPKNAPAPAPAPAPVPVVPPPAIPAPAPAPAVPALTGAAPAVPAPAPVPAVPAPAPGPSPGFPQIPLDSGFPLSPPGSGSVITKIITVTALPDDPEETTAKTPRPKQRRTRVPQSERGVKWFGPGDLADDEEVSSSDVTTIIRTTRRRPRSTPVNSTSIGQGLQVRCSKKGDEEQSGLHVLCGSCRVIRELPSDFYPRYINEVSCSGQTCFDKSTTGGGRCVEQLLNFDILRNVGTNECQKWTTYTIAVPVCCSCLMSDSLAQFLNMPWTGKTLTTSGPLRPNRPR